MKLPQDNIEYGFLDRDAGAPIAKGENAHFKASLLSWVKEGGTSTSADGTKTHRTYFSSVLMLQTLDPRESRLLRDSEVLLSNDAGLQLRMSRRIQAAEEWFAPSGRPLKANEKILLGSFTLPENTDLSGQWTLKVQARNDQNVHFNTAGQRLTTLEEQERNGTASSLELRVSSPDGRRTQKK